MAALIALAIAGIFFAGAIAGFFLLVSFAIRRDDLSNAARDRRSSAGRHLTSLYVRRPADQADLVADKAPAPDRPTV